MIYVCIASRNNAKTVGLLLWKIKKVLADRLRDYHLIISDDCSTDSTSHALEPYKKALPLTVFRQETERGTAWNTEFMLREALKRSDRHKRDLAITIPADFRVSPAVIPEMIRRFESGADVLVGEIGYKELSLSGRLTCRLVPWLLRPGVRVPGIRDFTSGCVGFRLITLKHCFSSAEGSLLLTEGLSARAELLARAAAVARQIIAIPLEPGPAGSPRDSSSGLSTVMELFRAGRKLAIPLPEAEVKRIS